MHGLRIHIVYKQNEYLHIVHMIRQNGIRLPPTFHNMGKSDVFFKHHIYTIISAKLYQDEVNF